jgi:hypothetical protein
MRMAKRGPQNRSTDTACLVRMTRAQRERLEEAVKKSAEGKPGLKPVVARFLLEVGLAEADRILGRD